MEITIPEFNSRHSGQEINNLARCEEVVRSWTESEDWPSANAIREIHKVLMQDVAEYKSKGVTLANPGEYRKGGEDIALGNERKKRENKNITIYVRGTDVGPLMSLFTQDLDKKLEKLPPVPPGNVVEIVKTAAWAYYVFGRIHPFHDGNGRTGRFIILRILSGSGFKEFFFPQDREQHLGSLEDVDNTLSLSSLELYLLSILKKIYEGKQNPSEEERGILTEINSQIEGVKKTDSTQQQRRLSRIWEGFRGLHYLWQPQPSVSMQKEKTSQHPVFSQEQTLGIAK